MTTTTAGEGYQAFPLYVALLELCQVQHYTLPAMQDRLQPLSAGVGGSLRCGGGHGQAGAPALWRRWPCSNQVIAHFPPLSCSFSAFYTRLDMTAHITISKVKIHLSFLTFLHRKFLFFRVKDLTTAVPPHLQFRCS